MDYSSINWDLSVKVLYVLTGSAGSGIDLGADRALTGPVLMRPALTCLKVDMKCLAVVRLHNTGMWLMVEVLSDTG